MGPAAGNCLVAAFVAGLFMMMPAGVLAAPAMPPPSGGHQASRTIQVTGNGEARVAPDLASLNLAIETHAPTAQESAGRNAALARKVVDALTGKLKGKGKVWTGGYSLYPEYSQPHRNEKPVVTGYRAENSITVETGEIGILGALIDTAVSAGANRINYLNFTLRNETKARSEAIAAAAADAKAQAESLAKSIGVKLGPIIKATTTAEVRPVPVMMSRAMLSQGMPTPVRPNEVKVPATVSLTYQIE